MICYTNVLKAPFLWDDEATVVTNPSIRISKDTFFYTQLDQDNFNIFSLYFINYSH